MIITRTPLRISFIGGGTDLPSYYETNDWGAVISATIDKYIYVIVKKRYDRKIRLGYSRVELVDNIEDLQHELIKGALKMANIDGGLEITTIADIPSTGSGLGSSGAVAVGVLNALYSYKGFHFHKAELAEDACYLEMELCNRSSGKQDQYASVFGGINIFRFYPDNSVKVESVELRKEIYSILESNLLLFSTGIARDSETFLQVQKQEMSNKLEMMAVSKMNVLLTKDAFALGDLDMFVYYLRQGWEMKKTFSDSITNIEIDEMFNKAMLAGASGGKLCGAGGGGYLLFYVPIENQGNVRKALGNYEELPFNLDKTGTNTWVLG